jgi:hypothetical protein
MLADPCIIIVHSCLLLTRFNRASIQENIHPRKAIFIAIGFKLNLPKSVQMSIASRYRPMAISGETP